MGRPYANLIWTRKDGVREGTNARNGVLVFRIKNMIRGVHLYKITNGKQGKAVGVFDTIIAAMEAAKYGRYRQEDSTPATRATPRGRRSANTEAHAAA